MKIFICLLLSIFTATPIIAQFWGVNTTSAYTNEAIDVETDQNGNQYVAGYITGETSFNINTVQPSAAGNGDIYISKYSPTGSLIWIKQFGGNYSDKPTDLVLDNSNNIYVTGQYFGQVNFGNFTLNSINNSKDIFLLKLNGNGDVLWAQTEGGTGNENAYGLSVDYQNNLVLTGQFEGQSILGGSAYISTVDPLTNLNSYDLFISKYDSSGNPIWVRTGQADYEDRGLAISCDDQNNIFLTGQFSDTLLFAGSTFNNIGYNVGFVAKISPNGQLLWLNKLKAGLVLPYDLEVNDLNEIVIAGDFTGNLIYQTASASQNVTNSYQRKIFALKISNNGNYMWSNTLGSDNDISARSISIDGAKNSYLTGYFKCNLTQLHDTNTAIFNSVGYKDIYLMKIDNLGNTEYIKQIGGKENDEGHGVAILPNNTPTICGSYTQNLNLPIDNSGSTSYSNSNNFGYFPYSFINYLYLLGDSTRNSFLSNAIHLNTPNYNYFINSPSDSLDGFINNGFDTLHFCVEDWLYFNTQTYNEIDPAYNYLWNTGSTDNSIYINQTGNYSVTIERDDQCAFGNDSIYAIRHELPLLPLMTDNLGLAINEPGEDYYTYQFCEPDSVTTWFNNLADDCSISIFSSSTNLILYTDTLAHQYTASDQYDILIQNAYCSNLGWFNVILDQVIPYDSIDPYLYFREDPDNNDTIEICQNTYLYLDIYDYVTNPDTTLNQFNYQPIVFELLTVDPLVPLNEIDNQGYKFEYKPISTGWLSFSYYLSNGYDNMCGIDTLQYIRNDSIYIIVNPLPSLTIEADNLLCPNGSAYLYIDSIIPGLNWNGPGISWISSLGDSIQVTQAGLYSYGGLYVDTNNYCSTNLNFTFLLIQKQAPALILNPADGIICPYDSVTFWLPNTYLSYDWIGPDGYSISTTNIATDADQGFYYCTVLDDEGCYLTTTPAEIKEFTTPFLTVEPFNVICPNQSATISVTYDGDAQFQWLAPITSNASQITVNQAGMYICQIQQCGMTFLDSVEIIDGSFSVNLTASDTMLCFNENSLLTTNPGYSEYNWSNGETGSSIISITDPGSYFVTVINQYGCEATSPSIFINEVRNSSPPIISNLTICPGADATLSTLNNAIVNWYDMDTNLLSTGNSFNVSNIFADTSFFASISIAECPNNYVIASISIMDSIPDFEIIGDTLLCPNELALYSINTSTETIDWYLNGYANGNGSTMNLLAPSIGSSVQLIEAIVSNSCYSDTIQLTINTSSTQEINLPFDSLIICSYSTVPIVPNGNYDSLIWSAGNGIISADTFYLTSQIGNGTLIVEGFDMLGCPTSSDTLIYTSSQLSFTIYDIIGNSCFNDTIILGVNTSADSLLWTTPVGFFDTTALSLEINASTIGWYSLEIWDTLGCSHQDSIYISGNQIPTFSISNDTLLCLNDWLSNLNISDSLTISWEGIGVVDSIPVIANDWYIVTAASAYGCVYSDSIYIQVINCTDDLPNVITANNDGVNDFFIIDEAPIFPNNHLMITNRWGNQVYEMSGYDNSFNGLELVAGTYFYIFEYDTSSKNSHSKSGIINIIR